MNFPQQGSITQILFSLLPEIPNLLETALGMGITKDQVKV